MNRCPKLGARVSFAGNNVIGPCVGVVERIYVERAWDEEGERDEAILPERRWYVSMRPDTLPEPWPYVGASTFAPQVAELKACGVKP